jgi:HlyD family secretion protein
MKKALLALLLSFLLLGCEDKKNTYQGYIEADYTLLSSPLSGALTTLNVKKGQWVKKNTQLFSLDSKPESFIQKEKKAMTEKTWETLIDMKKARRKEVIDTLMAKREEAIAKLAFLKQKHKRYQDLYKVKVLDKNTYDETVSILKQTEALIKQYVSQIANAKRSLARVNQINAQEDLLHAMQLRYEIASWQLKQKTLYAPYDGRIVDTFYQEGEYVTQSNPVLSLLKESNKYLLFFLPEPKLAAIKLGQTVILNCEGCKVGEKATINYISPYAEYTPPLVFSRENNPKLVYKIHASLQNTTHFHPGQPVMVNNVP